MVGKRHAWTALAAAVGTVLAVVAGIVGLAGTAWSNERVARPSSAASAGDPSLGTDPGIQTPVRYRNVVMILADDMDWALFDEVPRLAALKAQGTTFTNHTVTDSLCCPSRTSIMRSQYVHNHMVVSNTVSTGGGWPVFFARGEEQDCLATWLDDAGVQTGLFGKYLNEFPDGGPSPTYVPPGWDDFVASVSGKKAYAGYGYTLNENGKLKEYGYEPKDFLTDVLNTKASAFIRSATGPFFAYLAPYTPHSPAPAAKRHVGSHPGSVAPRTPAYNTAGLTHSTWRSGYTSLGPARLAKLDQRWRERVESAESIADSVDTVKAALAASGHLEDTLILVTSDNGYHVAAREMPFGKRTPYREDTLVPLIAIGPGVPAGRVVSAMTSTTDLGPTIAGVLGATPAAWVDGRSLQPFLDGGVPTSWRTATLSESLGTSGPGDPDYQVWNPPSFAALRSEQWLYVEYVNGDIELYDRTTDPWELNDVARTVDFATLQRLKAQLAALRACAGDSCRTADAM